MQRANQGLGKAWTLLSAFQAPNTDGLPRPQPAKHYIGQAKLCNLGAALATAKAGGRRINRILQVPIHRFLQGLCYLVR